MTIAKNLIGAAVAAACLAGCGGSSSSSDPLPSLYMGSWTGTWSGPLTNDGGTLTFTVTADGSFSGSMSRSSGSGTIGGIISNTGKMTGTASFATDGNFLISGQVVSAPGTLSGSFNYSWLGQEYTGSFSETSQSSSGSSSGV